MLFDKIKKNSHDDILDFNEKEYVTRKEFDKLKKHIETQQNFLNTIYIFYDLQPTPYLIAMRDLSYELMKFVDNVCRKHEIEYWMDYGTLLGAVRHRDFVPWDDDLDVGIMREDYNKLIEVLPNEVNQNNLGNLKASFKIDKHNNKSKRWYQLSYKHPNFKGKFIGVDFFPYDYMNAYDDDLTEEFNDSLTEYYHNPDKFTLEEYLEKFYNNFNLTLQKREHIIPGIDNVRGNIRQFTLYRQVYLRENDIFPIKMLKFGKYDLSAPNNSTKYLVDVYGKNYLKIPGKIRDHGRLNKYKKHENIIEILNEGIEMLKKANETY